MEQEPNYTYVTARILLDELRAEALSFLGVAEESTQPEMDEYYPKALAAFIDKGIELEMLDPKLKEYDLAKLGAALKLKEITNLPILGCKPYTKVLHSFSRYPL